MPSKNSLVVSKSESQKPDVAGQTNLPKHQTDPLQPHANLLHPQMNLFHGGHIDPPLIALPLEIKLMIFSYLDGPAPTLILLRRTHPHFRYIIPTFYHRRNVSHADKHDQLVAADQLATDEKQPKLFLPNRLACFTCLNVLPSKKFSDRNTYKARCLGGKDAHKRFCLDCGIKGSKYHVGQELYINRIRYILDTAHGLVRISEDYQEIGNIRDRRSYFDERYCENLRSFAAAFISYTHPQASTNDLATS